MGKRGSTRGIKVNRHYTYEDAADVLGLTYRTIRAWREKGLCVMTSSRPHLILGEDLIGFIESQHQPSGRLEPDQFRCFTCQAPRRALDRIVFYTSTAPKRGQLEAICEVCEGRCFRFAGEAGLPKLAQYFEIVRNELTQA
jgi:hypothetical protein